MSMLIRSRVFNQVKRISNVQLVNLTLQKSIQQRFLSSTKSIKSIHNDFRYSGTEKNAGALQDLLRRVMEIDAGITNTPIVEFKPNTKQCVGYYLDDDIKVDIKNLKLVDGFKIEKQCDNMVHILDSQFGGDVFLFDNRTLVYWGLSQDRQSAFLKSIADKDVNDLTKERMEFAIDEDEVTDVQGDIIILNPYLPSIELTKTAFSYGIGRIAKLNHFEILMNNYLDKFFEQQTFKKKDMYHQLLSIHRKLILSSSDGFLCTPDFHWAKPELEEYVNKISKRFDLQTRLAILNKKLDHARQLISTANDLDLFE